jgi:hypothetical protein
MLVNGARSENGSFSPQRRPLGSVHDEDAYFADSPGKPGAQDPNEIERLLKEIKIFADSYSAVGASLVSKVELEARKNHSLEIEIVENLPSAILDVVLTSCENHLMNRNDYPFGNALKSLADLER